MVTTDVLNPMVGTDRRIASYFACGIGLVILYVALRETTWQGTKGLHTAMEIAATLLASVVGALAPVHYYGRRNNTHLFIGTAFLEAYRAVVTSAFIPPYPPFDHCLDRQRDAGRSREVSRGGNARFRSKTDQPKRTHGGDRQMGRGNRTNE